MSNFYTLKKVIDWYKVTKKANEMFKRDFSMNYLQGIYRGTFKSSKIKKYLYEILGPYEKSSPSVGFEERARKA